MSGNADVRRVTRPINTVGNASSSFRVPRHVVTADGRDWISASSSLSSFEVPNSVSQLRQLRTQAHALLAGVAVLSTAVDH